MLNCDRIFKLTALAGALLILMLTAGFFLQLGVSSFPVWQRYGLGFLCSTAWDPVAQEYGALPAIVGTLITTALAVGLALPPAFVTALYLLDAPPWARGVLSQGVDLLAAIPSVIYGMWGLFVLVPLLQRGVNALGFEEFTGFGYLSAGVILALMILPYMCAVFRDVFRMTPSMLREAAFGCGCTRWEAAWDIVMRYGIRGIMGGVFIGLGRALGETMAVLFVIGNLNAMPDSLFSAGTTIAATLANNFAEADDQMQSVLFALGLLLLAMSFAVQAISLTYLKRTGKRRGEV